MEILLKVRSKADNSVQESPLLPDKGRVLVGRGPDCVVFLDGQGISREHLAVEVEGAAVFITDLSSNGSWLNGKRLPQNARSKVADDDLIELPGYEIRFQPPAAAPAQPVIPPTLNSVANEPETPAAVLLTRLDKFVIALAIASVVLLLVYLNY